MHFLSGVNKLCVLSLIYLLSCTKAPACQWQTEEDRTPDPLYSCCRRLLPADPPTTGLNVEIFSSKTDSKVYLFISSLPFEEQEPHYSNVTIETKDKEIKTQAYRLEGGQKLLLPQKAAEIVIETLEKKEPLIISSGRYSQSFDPA